MRALIFDVGIECIAKPYLILRIFVGFQDVQSRSHFTAAHTIFRSVKQQHVRLGKLEFRAVCGIFGFAVILVDVNKSILGCVFFGGQFKQQRGIAAAYPQEYGFAVPVGNLQFALFSRERVVFGNRPFAFEVDIVGFDIGNVVIAGL